MKTVNISKKDFKKIKKITDTLISIGEKYNVNFFQPGAMKEIYTSKILNHIWISDKNNVDACDETAEKFYEYLSCKEGGLAQMDHLFKDTPTTHEKYKKSMERITRNDKFYITITNNNVSKPTDILRIYEVSTDLIFEETNRQLNKSKNVISHVGFDETFAINNGKLIWEKPKTKHNKFLNVVKKILNI